MHSLFATRRAFLSTLGAAACLPAFGKKTPAEVPSILLIVAGDLPAEALSCYGNTKAATPNLDALARRGVHFQNALASSPGGPTGLATLLSGRTPLEHGVTTSVPLGPSEVLLSDLLSSQGFDVGFVGFWGLGDDKQPGHGIRWSYIPGVDAPYSPATLTQRAIEFLGQQKPDAKPFFLTVSHPWQTPASSIDNQLPELIVKIRERGMEQTTLIVVTSAGGSPESLRQPMIQCWPGHVPVESHVPQLVGSYDFLPTICEVTSTTAPDRNLCGRNYLPLVLAKPFPKKHPWKNMVFGAFGSADTASDGRFKLILRDGGKSPSQLFDMRDDPKQSTNEFSNRNYITARDDLRRNLMEWKAKYSK